MSKSKIKSLAKHLGLKTKEITQDPYMFRDEFEVLNGAVECITNRARVINEKDLGKGLYTRTTDRKYWFRWL
jgi:hypothetical protein